MLGCHHMISFLGEMAKSEMTSSSQLWCQRMVKMESASDLMDICYCATNKRCFSSRRHKRSAIENTLKLCLNSLKCTCQTALSSIPAAVIASLLLIYPRQYQVMKSWKWAGWNIQPPAFRAMGKHFRCLKRFRFSFFLDGSESLPYRIRFTVFLTHVVAAFPLCACIGCHQSQLVAQGKRKKYG